MKTAGNFLEGHTFETQEALKLHIATEFAGYDADGAEVTNIYKDINEAEILLFYYAGSYDGDAIVIYVKNGQLYEVNGSHCSCMGLEGQWAPEATTYEALAARYPELKDKDSYYDRGKNEAVRSILPGNLAYVN